MTVREKVIRELKAARLFFEMGSTRADGTIGNLGCKSGMKYIDDALELLKEQEAVRPVITPWRVNEDGEVVLAKRECGKCGWQFFTEKPNYCENCGTPILWESR